MATDFQNFNDRFSKVAWKFVSSLVNTAAFDSLASYWSHGAYNIHYYISENCPFPIIQSVVCRICFFSLYRTKWGYAEIVFIFRMKWIESGMRVEIYRRDNMLSWERFSEGEYHLERSICWWFVINSVFSAPTRWKLKILEKKIRYEFIWFDIRVSHFYEITSTAVNIKWTDYTEPQLSRQWTVESRKNFTTFCTESRWYYILNFCMQTF